MPVWLHRVHFRDLINAPDYNDPDKELEQIPIVGSRMSERLKQYRVFDGTDFSDRFIKVKTQAQFNRVLSDVYDFCDSQRIWIELKR